MLGFGIDGLGVGLDELSVSLDELRIFLKLFIHELHLRHIDFQRRLVCFEHNFLWQRFLKLPGLESHHVCLQQVFFLINSWTHVVAKSQLPLEHHGWTLGFNSVFLLFGGGVKVKEVKRSLLLVLVLINNLHNWYSTWLGHGIELEALHVEAGGGLLVQLNRFIPCNYFHFWLLRFIISKGTLRGI